MMGTRPVREPAELVIWGAAALLGIMVGIGTAFTLWSAFHRSAAEPITYAAVFALGLGLSLVAVAVDNLPSRLFIWAACGAMILAFFLGGSFFLALAG